MFTYNVGTPTNITRVRYHIGDTTEATAIYSDEEIEFVIDEEGTWQAAVISLIENILVKITHEPDMTADWLRVDWRRSSENWRQLLADKRLKFGITRSIFTSDTIHAFRTDSLHKEEPDYAELTSSLGDEDPILDED